MFNLYNLIINISPSAFVCYKRIIWLENKMAQNAPTDVTQYVTLNPKDKISFAVGVDKSALFLNNSSTTKNIAYKIRTTQPLIFVVKPNSGIIEAMSEAKIEINYVPNEVSPVSIQNFISSSTICVQSANQPFVHTVRLKRRREQVPSPGRLHAPRK